MRKKGRVCSSSTASSQRRCETADLTYEHYYDADVVVQHHEDGRCDVYHIEGTRDDPTEILACGVAAAGESLKRVNIPSLALDPFKSTILTCKPQKDFQGTPALYFASNVFNEDAAQVAEIAVDLFDDAAAVEKVRASPLPLLAYIN